MFERFTERARQVVVLAQEEARNLDHQYIGSEHVLLGLLREEDGVAARVLTNLGVTVQFVRDSIVRIVGKGGSGQSPPNIPFTPRGKKVLELALREALSLGNNYIGTEHILLGLVRENEGLAVHILAEADVEGSTVRDETVKLIIGGSGKRKEIKLPAKKAEPSRFEKMIDTAIKARSPETRSAAARVAIALALKEIADKMKTPPAL